METRNTNPDMNRDDMQRPDRAKHDEMGRTDTGDRPMKQSSREQPAKAVHTDTESSSTRGQESKKDTDEQFEGDDEDVETAARGRSTRAKADDEYH